ncbi:MAG: hypothetical protein K940chlam9_00737 [Chlamydiae bacterium]|nr:hypothetical protein [Chlamydiota bacterium]
MTFAAIAYSAFCPVKNRFCCGLLSDSWRPGGLIGESKTWVIMVGSVGFDALAAISLLVVGILGATSVITMSPAAAYSMIGISGAFILADVSVLITNKIQDACKKSNETKSMNN